YTYDRDGNRLERGNVIKPTFSELYHTNGASNGYDNFNQLIAFSRGTISQGSINNPSRSQSWTLDAVGNWATVTTDGVGQNRTHNAQNQISSISGATMPSYD